MDVLALPHSVIDDPYWDRQPQLLQLYLHVLKDLQFLQRTVEVDCGAAGIQRVDVQPGQSVVSLRRLSARWKQHRTTVGRWLAKLQEAGWISYSHADHFLLVSVFDWQKYAPMHRPDAHASRTGLLGSQIAYTVGESGAAGGSLHMPHAQASTLSLPSPPPSSPPSYSPPYIPHPAHPHPSALREETSFPPSERRTGAEACATGDFFLTPPPKGPKPKDGRSRHVAIQAVRELVGRYPDKVLWDPLIEKLGDFPDFARLKACWLAWRTRGYAPTNYSWAMDWYADGIPPAGSNGARQRGGGPAYNSLEAAAARVLAKIEEAEHDEKGGGSSHESGSRSLPQFPR